jgi:hypothetical protein
MRNAKSRPGERPKLTVKQILAWADRYFRKTGAWPHIDSGPVRGNPKKSWKNLDSSLREGRHGLRGGSSLPRLLEKHRRVRYRQHLPPLTTEQILAWADAHQRRTGHWPNANSGAIIGARGECWRNVDFALRDRHRGLPGGSSLARLLEAERGVRNRLNAARLTTRQILAWADYHHRRTGEWPTIASGPVLDAPEENWHAINVALGLGYRGLRGGSSLARLLRKRGKLIE